MVRGHHGLISSERGLNDRMKIFKYWLKGKTKETQEVKK